jgi:hypothetical protein
MQCAGQQPNQIGCRFSLPKKRQKHVIMVKPYPIFFHPQQSKVSVFITSSLCSTTDKHLFQICQQRFNRQSQYTTHIYSTKQTSNKSSKKKIGQNTLARRPQVTEHRPAGSMESKGESSGGSWPILWSQRSEIWRESVGRDLVEKEFRD